MSIKYTTEKLLVHESKIIEEYKKYYKVALDYNDPTEAHNTAVYNVSCKYANCLSSINTLTLRWQLTQEHTPICICGEVASKISLDSNDYLCTDCVNNEKRNHCTRDDDYTEVVYK